MRCFILVITNSGDTTADYLCGFTYQEHMPVLRLNTDRPLADLSIEFVHNDISLTVENVSVKPSEIAAVWLRRPLSLTMPPSDDVGARQFVLNEWAESLENFFAFIPDWKWINHPTYNIHASCKLEQLSRATANGLCVPETILTRDESVVWDRWNKWNNAMVAKPLYSGYIEREEGADSLLYTNRVTINDMKDIPQVKSCPTLFQQAINKTIDVRVTIIDQYVHAIGLSKKDSANTQLQDIRRDNMNGVVYRAIDMPHEVHKKLLSLTAGYNLRFAAVDFVVDRQGTWYFLEINPNGQWAWLDLAGATNIRDSFIRVFREAIERHSHE